MKKVNTFIFVTIIMLSLCACNNSSNKNHTHSFEQWEISKNPTCIEEGLKLDIVHVEKCNLKTFQL